MNRGVREKEGTRRSRRESENHGPAEVRVPPIHARIYTEVAPAATPHRRHHHHHHRHDHHTTSTTTTTPPLPPTWRHCTSLTVFATFSHGPRPPPSYTYFVEPPAFARTFVSHGGPSPGTGHRRHHVSVLLFTRLPMLPLLFSFPFVLLLAMHHCCHCRRLFLLLLRRRRRRRRHHHRSRSRSRSRSCPRRCCCCCYCSSSSR